MSERDLPTFQEDELNSTSNQNQDIDTTETIDLGHLFRPDLTESGSYDMGDVRHEALARLLQAIPLPAFLVDNSLRIKLFNRAAQTILRDLPGLIGSSLPSHFQSPKVRQKVLSAVKYTFQQRKSLIIEGRLGIGAPPIWGRMHVRSVRIGPRRLALVLIEDLTAEKELVVTQKYPQTGASRSGRHCRIWSATAIFSRFGYSRSPGFDYGCQAGRWESLVCRDARIQNDRETAGCCVKDAISIPFEGGGLLSQHGSTKACRSVPLKLKKSGGQRNFDTLKMF